MKIFSFTVIMNMIIVVSVYPQVYQNIPLLTVTGEGVYKAIPDQGIISVRVHRKVDLGSISVVTDAFLFDKENTNIKFFGEDNHEILSTTPEFDMRDAKNGVFLKEFIITVNDLSKLTRVINELLRRDFTQIYSIMYRVKDLNEIKNNARKMAVTNARATAEMFARQTGQSVGKIFLLEEKETKIVNWYTEKYLNGIEQVSTSYLSNPGYISIPSKVIVSFYLD